MVGMVVDQPERHLVQRGPGWQFTVAEYLGGIVMIVLMAVSLRLFVSRELEAAARVPAQQAELGHQHHLAEADIGWRARLTSVQAWSDVAHNFRGDWQMLWREISVGFLLAGFVAQLPDHVFQGLFVHSAPAPIPAIENAIIGPLIAAALIVAGVFDLLGLIPTGRGRPGPTSSARSTSTTRSR
jgi:uncharacterized protein